MIAIPKDMYIYGTGTFVKMPNIGKAIDEQIELRDT